MGGFAISRAARAFLAGAALLLSAAAGPARAQESSLDPYIDEEVMAEVTFGLNCAVEIVGSMDAPGTERGSVDVFDTSPEIDPQGQIVPALKGMGFGVRARAADGHSVTGATFRVTHPPFPTSGTTLQSWSASYVSRAFSTHLYRFDYPYEMVTGTWIMEAWDGDRLLYRIPFTVVPPEAYPGADSLCDPAGLLSALPPAASRPRG